MTDSYQKELEDDIATELETLGFDVFRCVVRQNVIDYRPEFGDLLKGTLGYPFVSLTSIVPELPLEAESFSQIASMERTVTVCMIGDRAVVETSMDPYRQYRQAAMKRIHMQRMRGSFTCDPNSCVLSNFVRPRPPIEIPAWIAHAKYISAFDVLFKTREAIDG